LFSLRPDSSLEKLKSIKNKYEVGHWGDGTLAHFALAFTINNNCDDVEK
jgi:hypothetical protein